MHAFPSAGPFLYADQLSKALEEKKRQSGFRELVLYVEACESGSMFEGSDLGEEQGVFATTAANAFESSWATYCPGDALIHNIRYIHVGSF